MVKLKENSGRLDRELSYIQTCLAYLLFSRESIPAIPDGLDWDRLLALLKAHRLAAFFSSLVDSVGATWPEDFRAQLLGNRHLLNLYGQACSERVQAVLSGLRTAGMNVIVLKGWTYIQTLYAGDFSLRHCEDIDILVPFQEIDQAEAVLGQLGYRPKTETWPGFHRHFHNAQAYVPQDGSRIYNQVFSVELHWGLFHIPNYRPAQMDIPALFHRARSLKVQGVNVLELSPEDQIVYACAHLGLHHADAYALRHYYEIGALIRRAEPELDWELVTARSHEWQCSLPLQRVMLAMDPLWPGLVPVEAQKKVGSLRPIFRERFVEWWLDRFSGRPSWENLLIWITTPGLLSRLEMAFKLIFPSPIFLQQRYGHPPAGFWPLLYLRWFMRGLHLMGKGQREGELGYTKQRRKRKNSAGGQV